MMPISAIESGAPVAEALREAARRLGHQTSNAANAAAVNVEVLRSRLARGNAEPGDLMLFAEHAAASIEQVTAGVAAVRALIAAIAGAARRSEALHVRAALNDPGAVELLVPDVPRIEPAAERFAATAGITLRSTPAGVILRVLRRETAEGDATR
jgi:hypothetical protein